MNKQQFHQLLQQGPALLDGGTGTHLQAGGMPSGVAPEIWVLEHPDVLKTLQKNYMKAGSRIICTSTFGANRAKMSRYISGDTNVHSINSQLASISVGIRDQYCRENPGRPVYVAGDIGPTGHFLFPAGDMALSELVGIFREQVRGLLAGGVDLFILETMIDLAEIRAALLAVQAECTLPILASLTYEENGHTLAGNSPLECLITLAALGVDACGINCSFGPEKLGELIEPLRQISPVPLILKPNAGLPVLVDGTTVFPMGAEAFANSMLPLVRTPVLLVGGCCGTGPDHIAALHAGLAEKAAGQSQSMPVLSAMICSARQTWQVEGTAGLPVIDVGSPDALADDVMDVLDDEPPAVILDFDSSPSRDIWPDLLESLQQLQIMVSVPLIFRSSDVELLGQLLYHYCGRAGVIGPLPEAACGALAL